MSDTSAVVVVPGSAAAPAVAVAVVLAVAVAAVALRGGAFRSWMCVWALWWLGIVVVVGVWRNEGSIDVQMEV